MATSLERLEKALRAADAAGDSLAAKQLAQVLKQERSRIQESQAQMLPPLPGEQTEVRTVAPAAPADPSLVQQAIGAGETALTLATGATGGIIGSAAGTLGQAAREALAGQFGTNEAASRIAQAAEERAADLTYAPRTEAGQRMAQSAGNLAAPLAALGPMGGLAAGEAQAVSAAAREAAGLGRAAAQAAKPALNKAADAAKDLRQRFSVDSTTEAGGADSVGAARNTQETVRRAEAASLPVPIELNKGEATRDFDDLRFERETAKTEAGRALREKAETSNVKLQQNFDVMIDDIGATLSQDKPALGAAVQDALKKDYEFAKKKTNYKYKLAEAKGDMDTPADLAPLATFLNENRASRLEDGIMSQVQKKLDVMGVSSGNFADGSMQVGKMNLKQAEDLIQFINGNTDFMDGREARMAGQLKSTIDGATEGVGNKYYKDARAARREQAERFESVGLVRNLLGTKRGTEDKAIAIEDVLNQSVLGAGAKNESLAFLRKTLNAAGAEGQQAWRELQGGTLAYIRDKALTTATDSAGNAVMSAAALEKVLDPLIKTGKLDIILPRQARTLEVLRDVAKYVQTAPPGAVNTSNTASALMTLMAEAGAWGAATGLPVPVVQGLRAIRQHITDKKLQAKIAEHLKQPNKDL
jgi:hypothetical protein